MVVQSLGVEPGVSVADAVGSYCKAGEVLCPGCASIGSSPQALGDACGLDLRRCKSCSLVFVANAAVDEDLYAYYERRVGLGKDELYIPLTTARLRAVLDRLAPMVPGRRLLDVGCGEGQLIDAAVAGGWDPLGIDLSPAAVEIAQSFGLPCQVVDLYSDDLEFGSFDVVTMIEVLEHIPDPGPFLARAADLLRPGGLLYLTTPNLRSLGRHLLGASWPPLSPEHVVYFSPRSLRRLVSRWTDLDVVDLETRNISAAALRRLMPFVRAAPAVDVGAHIDGEFGCDQDLRHAIERSRGLRIARQAANGVLGMTRMGEAMAVTLRHRG